MIKKTSGILFICSAVLLASCGGSAEGEEVQAEETQEINGVFDIDTETATINWNGYEPDGGHSGIVSFSEGQVIMDNGELAGGSFAVDMNTIQAIGVAEDEAEEEEHEHDEHGEEHHEHEEHHGEDGEEEGEHNEDDELSGHLKNADFFDVPNFPLATFTITKVEKGDADYKVTGDFEIRGVKKELSFDASVVDRKFKAKVAIDRTLFGINYGIEGINAEFDVEVEFTF